MIVDNQCIVSVSASVLDLINLDYHRIAPIQHGNGKYMHIPCSIDV